MTARDLLQSDLVGLWADRDDIGDSLSFARRLRRQAEYRGNEHDRSQPHYGIRSGDTFRLVDLDGVFVLTPMVPMVPELAREIERMREEAGLSIEELLAALRQQRERGGPAHGEG